MRDVVLTLLGGMVVVSSLSLSFPVTTILLLASHAHAWQAPGDSIKNPFSLRQSVSVFRGHSQLHHRHHRDDERHNEGIEKRKFANNDVIYGGVATPLPRRQAFSLLFGGAATAAAATTMTSFPSKATADEGTRKKEKYMNLSNEELAKYITKDVVENQFLVSAKLTREIYDESATFTDEIDTYQIDKWITGTQKLFDANESNVNLVPNSLQVSDRQASFLFTEILQFNIPILKPLVYLSGKVILDRDVSTGLITSYREVWDDDVATVLKNGKYFGAKYPTTIN